MFSPVCAARVRPLSADERQWQLLRSSAESPNRRRSGTTFGGKQLGCVRQQADSVLALVSDKLVQTPLGEAFAKDDFQLDYCYVPEVIDFRRARRPSMFGSKDGQDPQTTQQSLMFAELMIPQLRRSLKEGALTCVLVTGEARSGKSYTLFGSRASPGLVPQTVATLAESGSVSRIELSVLEVYDEAVRDLLNPMMPERRLRLRPLKANTTVMAADGAKRLRIASVGEYWHVMDEVALLRSAGHVRPTYHQRRGHLVVHMYVWAAASSSQSASQPLAYSEITFVDTAATPSATRELCKSTSSATASLQRLQDVLATSTVTKSHRTLTKCLTHLGDMGSDYSAAAVSELPTSQSTLTALLQSALGGRQQLLCVACISPSLRSYDVSKPVLSLASRLRYARFPSLPPRPEDPAIKYVQALSQELADIKLAIKALETSRKSDKGESKSVLLQRLVECTEELQEASATESDRRARQRTLQQQRSRALAKVRQSMHAPGGSCATDGDAVRFLLIPSPLPAAAAPPLWSPPAVTTLRDGETLVGTSDECQFVLQNKSKAPAPPALDELVEFFGSPGEAADVPESRSIDQQRVFPLHCIVSTSELEYECWLALPCDTGLEGETSIDGQRCVFLNGERLASGSPNRRLHHLDRVVIGPWVFQVLLPVRWQMSSEELEALARKKLVRKNAANLNTTTAAPQHVLKFLQTTRGREVAASAGSLSTSAGALDPAAFSRITKTKEHVELLEMFDRVAAELCRLDELHDVIGEDAWSVSPNAVAEVRELLLLHSILHSRLVEHYPPPCHAVSPATGRPIVAACGDSLYFMEPTVDYTYEWVEAEVRAGKPQDEDDDNSDAGVPLVNHRIDDRSTSAPVSAGEPCALPAAANVDDIFDELDSIILGKDAARVSLSTHSDTNNRLSPAQSAAVRKVSMSDDVIESSPTTTAQAQQQRMTRRKSVAFVAPSSSSSSSSSDGEEEQCITQARASAVPTAASASSSVDSAPTIHGASLLQPSDETAGSLCGLRAAERELLSPFVADADPFAAAKALQATLSKDMALFHKAVRESRLWKPNGPLEQDSKQDKALYDAAVKLQVHRNELTPALVKKTGTIFKLRVRRSLFHRGGFYPVDAYIAGRFLLYFQAKESQSTKGSPSSLEAKQSQSSKSAKPGDACLGSCYLYGAALELLVVGSMQYCIQITSRCPRKTTKNNTEDTSANRVVLGFSTRPLQLEWLEKLRIAVLPDVPAQISKYFGQDAARYLLLHDEAGLFSQTNLAEVGNAETALTVASISTQKLNDDALESFANVQLSQCVLETPVKSAEMARVVADCNKFLSSEASQLNELVRASVPATAETANVSDVLQRLNVCGAASAARDAALRRDATRLLCSDSVAPGGPASTPTAEPSSPPSADDKLPLRQVHRCLYLKYYHRALPVVLLAAADGDMEWNFSEELLLGLATDGNMTAVERDVLLPAHGSAPARTQQRVAARTQWHYWLVDHFSNTVEIVDPSSKKAAVFYGREVLHVSPSRVDPKLVVLTLFHTRVYLYAERFYTFEDRERFLDSIRLMRQTSRVYAPWLMTLFRRRESAKGILHCTTCIDGKGSEAVTVTNAEDVGIVKPVGSASAPMTRTLRLEGEVRCAVTSDCLDTASVWVGSWNLGGVPFFSAHIIETWTRLHLPQLEGSCEDILVFSLQHAGGGPASAAHREERSPQVQRDFALGEHIAAVLSKREAEQGSSGTVYRVVKTAGEEHGDMLIVVAKAHIAVQLGSISAQVLSPPATLVTTRQRKEIGGALAVSFSLGRSNCCVLSVRLPATAATSNSQEMQALRQGLLSEYVARLHLGDRLVDATAFFDAMIVCGDFADPIKSSTMSSPDGAGFARLSKLGPGLSAALPTFQELPIGFAPTCPVILGTQQLPVRCVDKMPKKKAASKVSDDCALREVCYSGRVLTQASHVWQTKTTVDDQQAVPQALSLRMLHYYSVNAPACSSSASCEKSLQKSKNSEEHVAALQDKVSNALLIAETLPVASVGILTFLRDSPVLFQPDDATDSYGAVPFHTLTLQRLTVTFPTPALHPSLMQAPRWYVSSQHGIVAAAHVSTPATSHPESTVSTQKGALQYSWDDLRIVMTLRSRDERLVYNDSIVVSLVWGLAGAQASVAGSAVLPLRQLVLRDEVQTARLPLLRAGRAIGELNLAFDIL